MADDPACPHCGTPLPIHDSDWYPGHTTYWGEDEPVEHQCWHCDVKIYVRERVERTWHVGRTPEEADDA